jgi:hypothetical protein
VYTLGAVTQKQSSKLKRIIYMQCHVKPVFASSCAA